jgi:hypothetical protein
MILFMVLNLSTDSCFFLTSLVGNIIFFNSHYPVATLGLDLISGTHLNKLWFHGAK